MSDDRIERLTKGDRFPVNPDAIERELAALWREAGEGTPGRQPVTRACLWNVAVHSEERAGEVGHRHQPRLEEMIRELPKYLASRALVLRTQPDAPGAPELESWISANCVLAPEGGKVVCSEEITLASHGGGEVHLPSLLRALLVPDVPTAVVFASVPSEKSELFEGLLEAADRVIVRCDAARAPGALERVHALARSARLGAMDLEWIAQGSLRLLIAELFDPPADDSAWQSVREVRIVHRDHAEASSRVLLAWIAAVLGAKKPTPAGRRSWQAEAGGARTLDLHLETAASDAPASPMGISTVILSGGGRTHAVRMLSERLAEIVPDGTPPRQALVERPSDSALLAAALRSRSEDGSLLKALSFAAVM